jgi:hypothetical protein
MKFGLGIPSILMILAKTGVQNGGMKTLAITGKELEIGIGTSL